MRLRISGPQAIVVAIAASTASRCSGAPKLFQELQEDRAGAARPDRLDHQLGAHVLVGLGGQKQRARRGVDLDPFESEALVARILELGMGEQVDQRIGAGERAFERASGR